MHLRIDRDVLHAAVSYTAKAIPPRPAQPIYSGLLLVADEKLTLSAFDYSDKVAAVAVVDAEIVEAGQMLLPGKLLAEIAKSLPSGLVTIEPDGNRVRLTSGKAKFVLPLMPVADYPKLPVSPGHSGVVSADVFAAAIEQVSVAVGAPDIGLASLTGILMEVEGDKITLVATDRYRLAVRELTWRPTDPSISAMMILPKQAILDGVKGLRGDGVELSLGLNADGMFGLSGATRSTTMGAIDSEFVNWRQIISTPGKMVATVNAALLAESVDRVATAKQGTDPLRITFGEDAFKVWTGGASGEESAGEDEVVGTFDGGELTVGFNPGFLRDGLKVAGTDEVQLCIETPLKPVIVTGKDGGDEFRYLVMPVRLPG